MPYCSKPETLGEHLKKRRMELGLLQREVARRMRVAVDTIIAWEKDRKEPETRYWPAITAFLGYDLHPKPQTLGDRLRAKYRELGIPRKEIARRFGMDENTLQYYERGTWAPTKPRSKRIIERLFDLRPKPST